MKKIFPILSLKNIYKRYCRETVINNISFSVNNAEFLVILGPSGCGKTTILRLIGGFEYPDSGIILFNEININNVSPLNRKVNTVFQNYALFPHLNVFNNIAFGLLVEGKSKQYIKQEVYKIIEVVGLEKFLYRKPDQLSGGQKQRVAIARAIIKKPNILLLDEPLSALDKKLRQKMQLELKNIQKSLGITFILITHDQDEALSVADKIIVMSNGKIQQIGTPRDIYETPKNLFVADFVGEINMFDAKVVSIVDNNITLYIENKIHYHVINNINLCLKINDKVKVLFRPEDIQTINIQDTKILTNILIGKVLNITYRGSTLEALIVLESGKKIKASEFFSGKKKCFNYKMGDHIAIKCFDKRGIILKDEK